MDIGFAKKRWLIAGFIFVILLGLYTFKNTSFLIRSLSAMALIVFFYAVDHLFNVRFRFHHYLFIFTIAVTGFLLSPLYFIYPNFDKILHIIQPFMLASIVYHMVSQLKLKTKWDLVFTFFIIVGSLALFELGEYALDLLFDLKLQGVFLWDPQGLQKFNIILDRNDDTMIDIALGTLSAALYAGFQFIQSPFKKKQLSRK